MKEVLLFSCAADSSRAARVHADSCPLVTVARRSRMGRVQVIESDLEFHVADLNERGFPVKRCKCLRAFSSA